MAEECPSFRDAVVRFRKFLASNGEAAARAVYTRGVRAGLGAAICGLWHDDRYTYAQVERPVDDDASERRLFPVGSLKMSAPTVGQENTNSMTSWFLEDTPELEQSALTD